VLKFPCCHREPRPSLTLLGAIAPQVILVIYTGGHRIHVDIAKCHFDSTCVMVVLNSELLIQMFVGDYI